MQKEIAQLQEKLWGQFIVTVKLEVCSKAGVTGSSAHKAMCLFPRDFQSGTTNPAGKQENGNGNPVVIMEHLSSSLGWLLPRGQHCVASAWKPGLKQ